jgi:hypothetical protein
VGAEEAMIARFLLPLAAMLVVACASVAPGEDEKGKQYFEPANQVLDALERYKKDQGRYPTSLYELVPKYVEKLPDEPTLRLDEYSGTMRFAYSREWPNPGRVVCVAVLGAHDWKCEDVN